MHYCRVLIVFLCDLILTLSAYRFGVFLSILLTYLQEMSAKLMLFPIGDKVFLGFPNWFVRLLQHLLVWLSRASLQFSVWVSHVRFQWAKFGMSGDGVSACNCWHADMFFAWLVHKMCAMLLDGMLGAANICRETTSKMKSHKHNNSKTCANVFVILYSQVTFQSKITTSVNNFTLFTNHVSRKSKVGFATLRHVTWQTTFCDRYTQLDIALKLCADINSLNNTPALTRW